MTSSVDINNFLYSYSTDIQRMALNVRELLLLSLPDINEQIDSTAKMIAYSYGNSYRDLICVIIPSKKGLKVGFNRGVNIPDPDKLLEGNGKISRYVSISSESVIKSEAFRQLLHDAYIMYKNLN
ncbi:MAG: DUF1801 domain-containing protein [Bacteroidales bacterium]|nr:DUF1801 domain-containing protein [Bacteroidales bacterium]